MNPFKRKGSTLGKKLKGALTDVSVDVFGYEKIVKKNILHRTNYISKRLEIPSERIYIKIFQKDHTIKSFLYNQRKPIARIPTGELTYFFLEEHLAQLGGFQNKVAFSIKKYLKELATANHIEEESVRIIIHVKDNEVYINAFHNEAFIKLIPLKSLIKFFK